MEKKRRTSSKPATIGSRDSRSGITFRLDEGQTKKKNSADDARETIQKFHQNLRKSVKSKRRRNNSAIDSKYGRWLPKNRYNIDQVPLPFVIDQDKTYDLTGNTQVRVSQPSTGLDKRQATLQLCIRAEGEQNIKPAIVFRAKGNVASAEKAEYNPGVDVYFHAMWEQGWRSVRALASHQCGLGSIPGLGVICGLSLLVLYSAPRGFSPGTPVFPSPLKPTFDLI